MYVGFCAENGCDFHVTSVSSTSLWKTGTLGVSMRVVGVGVREGNVTTQLKALPRAVLVCIEPTEKNGPVREKKNTKQVLHQRTQWGT